MAELRPPPPRPPAPRAQPLASPRANPKPNFLSVKEPAGVAGNQPLAFLFPKRIGGLLTLVSSQQYAPLLADDFLLLTTPNYEAGKPLQSGIPRRPQAPPGKQRNKDR